MFKAEARDWLRCDRPQPSGFRQRVFSYGIAAVKLLSGGLELVNAKAAGRFCPAIRIRFQLVELDARMLFQTAGDCVRWKVFIHGLRPPRL